MRSESWARRCTGLDDERPRPRPRMTIELPDSGSNPPALVIVGGLAPAQLTHDAGRPWSEHRLQPTGHRRIAGAIERPVVWPTARLNQVSDAP